MKLESQETEEEDDYQAKVFTNTTATTSMASYPATQPHCFNSQPVTINTDIKILTIIMLGIFIHQNMGRDATKPVLGVFDKAILKLGSSATETS